MTEDLSLKNIVSRYSYATIAPGPGAYDLLSFFGAQPRVPMARRLCTVIWLLCNFFMHMIHMMYLICIYCSEFRI